MYFFCKIIDNFIQNGTLQNGRYNAPGPSYTVVTEETVAGIEKYFSENPNSTIRKTAQVLEISKSSLYRIVNNFLKLHPYKITTHQLLTTRSMETRVKFCKIITEMFESSEIDESKIVFSDEVYFWLNGYVNKQNYRFWDTENRNISISKSLHPGKITLWVTLSVNISLIQGSLGIVTKSCWRQSSFLLQRREIGLRLFILCKMEQRPIAPKKCSRVFTMYMEIE